MKKKMQSRIRLEEWITAQTPYSRRDVVGMIINGKVTINGVQTKDISASIVQGSDVVHLNGKRIDTVLEYSYYKFHKPTDVISTMIDPAGRRCLKEFMKHVPDTLAPIGRLDRDSEGLLLFTNDGRLTQALSHPKFHVLKEYRVTVDKPLTSASIDRLTTGFFLDDGPVLFDLVVPVSDVTVVVKIGEGRNRIVRRSLELLGYTVKKLKRLSIGPIQLGNLEAGRFVKMTTGEMRQLDQTLKFR